MYTSESIFPFTILFRLKNFYPRSRRASIESNTIFHSNVHSESNHKSFVFNISQSGDSAESDRHGIRKKEREKEENVLRHEIITLDGRHTVEAAQTSKQKILKHDQKKLKNL